MARNEGCSKNQRVEMTAMIRREYERAVRRQLLTTDDREPMCNREITLQQRKTSLMRETFKKAAFASDAAEAFAWSKAGVARWTKLPGFHRLGPRKNSLRLSGSDADKIIDVMKYGRRDENKAVEAIKNAAVTGNEFCGVLQPEIALDG